MSFLEIKDLSKQFKEIKAVNNISFKVEKGEVLGLLGPNGAGKSTTISMISTLLNPNGGDIIFEGNSILKNPALIRSKLGIVPQDIALYPDLPGKVNLEFFGKSYGLKGKELKSRIEEVSKIIGITDRLKDDVKKYSGGMKRRLNIGASLIHDPELIIMDEPTVGIDPQSRNHILESVKELSESGKTIIYTSHYMEEVEALCGKVCIMDKGSIIASGTLKELKDLVSDKEVFNLSIANPDENIIEKLNLLDVVTAVKAQEQKGSYIITSNSKGMLIKEVINFAYNEGYEVTSIDIEEQNLESVFLHLTGRALRD